MEIRQARQEDVHQVYLLGENVDEFQFISVLTPPDDIAAIATYEEVGFSKGEVFLWLDVA